MYDGAGKTYTGTKNTTKLGHDCLPWDVDRVEILPGDDPQNFCRNPRLKDRNSFASVPWCLVNAGGGSSRKVYEECDLKECCEYCLLA